MARRNLFQPPPPPGAAPDAIEAEARQRFPNTGAMSGVKSTLRDLSSNAVREIDPQMIDDDGPKDRLAILDMDVASLAESIRLHGQQVPILVRPLPQSPGRYRIVYGRRRLRALKLAGLTAKALIRTLSDEQAIVAQGQENSLRLDPSFIEKASFAVQLSEAGYSASIILDALAVDKPMLSRMAKVARTIPEPVVQFIGPAHGIGRRRWEELADLAREHRLDLAGLVDALPPTAASLSSDDRFALVFTAAANAKATGDAVRPAPPALLICDADGRSIADLRVTTTAVAVRISRKQDAGFADWMLEHAEREFRHLYQRWQADKG